MTLTSQRWGPHMTLSGLLLGQPAAHRAVLSTQRHSVKYVWYLTLPRFSKRVLVHFFPQISCHSSSPCSLSQWVGGLPNKLQHPDETLKVKSKMLLLTAASSNRNNKNVGMSYYVLYSLQLSSSQVRIHTVSSACTWLRIYMHVHLM